ncbi:hypothetical protein ABMZ73_11940 [Morganella morganii]|uniref:hypothetical protein n=1 Tax=Morganella morganii TaxID=582 RepID=UPI003EBC10C3
MGEKMKNTGRMVSTIKMKWWVPAYIAGLKLFAVTFGTEPNYSRIGEFIVNHGVSIKTRFEETPIL